MVQLHDDALVLTLQTANHNVHRILVDSEGLVDMLFCPTYNSVGLPPGAFKPTNSPLYGFLGCII